MPNPLRVLVTGSAGRIGSAAVAELRRRGHRVRGFDRVSSPGVSEEVIGDLGDPDAVHRAMRGIECLVHLAATPDDDDVLRELVPNNIVGLYHVMEAARAAGVRRLILASSGQVNSGQQVDGPLPIHATDAVTPRYWYAATKMFLESIGYSYSTVHGMSVIVARLGWCPRTRAQVEEIAAADWAQDVYLSPNDAGRFVACAVEAPDNVRHAIVYATSQPIQKVRFDLSAATDLIGYEPLERWPMGTDAIT